LENTRDDEIEKARLEQSPKLLKEFFAEADVFELSDAEQKCIAGISLSDKLLNDLQLGLPVRLSDNMIQRLVIFLSIVGDIKILYPPEHCSNYLRAPNKAFDGESPLDLLTSQSIDSFTRVSAYLKGSILGGFG